MRWRSVKFPPRVARPVQPVGGEVHPHALGANPRVVHHLKRNAAPPLKAFLVQRRAIPRDHHLTGHRLEQLQQLDMVRLLVVEPVAALRGAGAPQIRRVAVEELRALERILAEEPVGAAVDELDGVVALELAERPRVAVDGAALRFR